MVKVNKQNGAFNSNCHLHTGIKNKIQNMKISEFISNLMTVAHTSNINNLKKRSQSHLSVWCCSNHQTKTTYKNINQFVFSSSLGWYWMSNPSIWLLHASEWVYDAYIGCMVSTSSVSRYYFVFQPTAIAPMPVVQCTHIKCHRIQDDPFENSNSVQNKMHMHQSSQRELKKRKKKKKVK